MTINNRFITFEGPEGSGKTTISMMVHNYLSEEGYDVIWTREPGGIEIAEQIRSVILNPNNTKMDGRTEALLYAAARRQHLVEKVIPALESGKIVLCDRFLDSSLAYQGYARDLGIKEVLEINQFAIDSLMPSLTIYFDISPEVGLARIEANKDREFNRLDMEKLHFHNAVREGYYEVMNLFPGRIRFVNAEESIDEVFESVKRILGNIDF